MVIHVQGGVAHHTLYPKRSKGEAMAFHEYSIREFCWRDGIFRICVESFVGDLADVKEIEITNMRSLFVDGEEVLGSDYSMSHSDGEVLTFEFRNDGLLIIVEWKNFLKHEEVTNVYEVFGGDVKVTSLN